MGYNGKKSERGLNQLGEPVLGEIRRGKLIGRTSRSNYIWSACIVCGIPRWVMIRHGKLRDVQCHRCAVKKPWTLEKRANHTKAIKEMQFKRDVNGQKVAPPYIGEIRQGRFVGKSKGTRASTNYIWLRCLDCGKTRWVTIKKGKPKNLRCHSCARKLVWSIPDNKVRFVKTMQDANARPEVKAKHSKIAKEQRKNPVYVAKLSKSAKEAYASPKYKNNIHELYSQPESILIRSNATKRNWEDEKYREKQIKRFIKQWADPNWKNRQVKLALEGNNIKPNKPETLLNNILDELYPGDWKYTGDGSFIIDGLNPDFVNVNGKKQIIELFGDWWHSDKKVENKWRSSEEGRIETFSQYGYRCLVIWERELKEPEKVKTRVAEFVG
jgi:hypothetical protein